MSLSKGVLGPGERYDFKKILLDLQGRIRPRPQRGVDGGIKIARLICLVEIKLFYFSNRENYFVSAP